MMMQWKKHAKKLKHFKIEIKIMVKTKKKIKKSTKKSAKKRIIKLPEGKTMDFYLRKIDAI
jgi:hypothetical protein